MMKAPQRILAVLLLSAVAHSAAAVSIVFDYSYDSGGFFADTAQKYVESGGGLFRQPLAR